MPNRLQFEQSPYLLQHLENPVDWRPWGSEAFQTAWEEDKPVFLSIGYSTCHWCHVMAHESFEDETVAEAINRDFIPIKVDREERPDVDAVYMAACVAMTGSGGWPLTVLLTPEQKPFWAGTYLPRQALLSLLQQAARLWREDRGSLLTAGEALTDRLREAEGAGTGFPDRALAGMAAGLYARSFDTRWGGFGHAPKFPTPHNLIFLLRYARRTGEAQAGAMAEQTLESMYRGGLFDHVGGGFARYSTDEMWLVPHFEKMLYDNALLALAYTEAYQQARRPLYGEIVRRTLDYVLRELRDFQGGFYCGQDADSEGEEGKYYVFTAGELRDLLGPEDAEAFCGWYGVTETGNFAGKNILNLIGREQVQREPVRIRPLRERVYAYRLERTCLHRDDKVLAAWNGLMIAALARAGLALDEPRYRDAAVGAAAFLKRSLTEENGRLLARWRAGQAAHPGKLDDYAFCAWGLLELYGVTFRTAYLAEARDLTARLLEQFFDGKNGGFYPYAADGEQLITRTKETYDGGHAVGQCSSGAGSLPPGPPHRGGPLADRRRSAAGLSGWGYSDLSRRTRFCHAGVSGGAVALGGAGLRGPDHAGGVGGFSAGGLQARTDGAGENAGDGKAAGGACPLHGGLSDSGDRRPVLSMPERRLCPAGGQYFRSQTAAGTELRILPKGLRRTARFAA